MKSLNSTTYENDAIKRWFQPAARTLDLLQAMTTEGFAGFGKSMIGDTYDQTKYYVLFGLIKTTSGGGFSISDGVLFFNGEYILVTGATIDPVATALTVHIQKLPIAGDPATFTDGFTANVHLNNAGTIEDHAIGGAWIDFSTLVRLSRAFYTPNLGVDGAGTVANISTIANYRLAGNMLVITISSSFTCSVAADAITFSLPPGFANPGNKQVWTVGSLIDNGAATERTVAITFPSSNNSGVIGMTRIDGTQKIATSVGTYIARFQITILL